MFRLAFLLAIASIANSQPGRTRTFPLTGAQDLLPGKARLEPVEYKGRKSVRMSCGNDGQCFSLLRDVQFDDGVLEADVAVKLTTPPGVRNPGFIGLAFRARSDARHYDLFYIRPGNSHTEDQAMRNHAVQYVAYPDHDWYRLRREWPWAYESAAELQLETWTHIKIEVEGRRARLFVNGAPNPVLVVNGLRGEDLTGAIGLSGSAGQESYFSNVRITPAKRQPIENGGEADGVWNLTYSSDAGNYEGVLQLRRDGEKVSGTATGLFGSDLPVSGTWRNGYIELWFKGAWPSRDPGDANVRLAGWIDGDIAKGRMAVIDRADGVWTATRK